MFQYWIDFFGAIWGLIKTTFIGLVIVIVALVAIELIPLWVFAILFGILLLYLYAHGVAVEKQNRREKIDADIEAWKADIQHRENVIVTMYQHIANAKPDEDTRRYVLTIERAEEAIERNKEKIKRLMIERTCV